MASLTLVLIGKWGQTPLLEPSYAKDIGTMESDPIITRKPTARNFETAKRTVWAQDWICLHDG